MNCTLTSRKERHKYRCGGYCLKNTTEFLANLDTCGSSDITLLHDKNGLNLEDSRKGSIDFYSDLCLSELGYQTKFKKAQKITWMLVIHDFVR